MATKRNKGVTASECGKRRAAMPDFKAMQDKGRDSFVRLCRAAKRLGIEKAIECLEKAKP